MEHLEEKIAHLQRVVDDLSDVISRQSAEIDTLTRRVAMLMQREAEREADAGSHLFSGNDRPPPHY
jgi:SlyX protein